jgi:ribosomal protein L37AE/L43A
MQEVDLGAVVSWVCRKCGTEIVEHEYDDDFSVEKIYRRKRNKVVI